MNRRGFLRMLGTGVAVGGVAAVAPSQVWPFRKIFLPLRPTLDRLMQQHLAAMLDVLPEYLTGTYPPLYGMEHSRKLHAPCPGPLLEGLDYTPLAPIDAIQLEAFAKEIPDLVYGQNSLYEAIRRKGAWEANYHDLIGGHQFRLPMRFEPWHGRDFVRGDMSMDNLNRSEIIAGSLNEKPAYKLRRAARRFVDSLKVRNEDLGWDG